MGDLAKQIGECVTKSNPKGLEPNWMGDPNLN